jgi:D-3-phosphoglycerate dehydrogenase
MKILVTCPPMIQRIESIRNLSELLGLDLIVPNFKQTVPKSELLGLIERVDGWIIGDDIADREILEKGFSNQLRAVVKWGIGVDSIDVDVINKLGIKFTNTPKAFGNEVADLAIGYLVALTRKFHEIDKEVRLGNWYKPSGISLFNKNAVIIGFGDIGQAIAERLTVMGLNISYFDPNVDISSFKRHTSVSECVSNANFIFLSCALNKNTRNLINSELISKMRKGVYIINVSRGGLINENDLVQGLKNGIIEAVALDVFNTEPVDPNNWLLRQFGCVFGSHNASNTIDAVDKTSEKAIYEMYNFLTQ